MQQYQWLSGHTSVLGIMVIGVSLFLACSNLWTKKQRLIAAPTVGVLAGLIFLVAKVDDRYAFVAALCLFAGYVVDITILPQPTTMSRLSRIGTATSFIVILSLWAYLGVVRLGDMYLLTEQTLSSSVGRIFHKPFSTTIPRNGAQVTLIHVSDGNYNQWRIRSASLPPEEIFIDSTDLFRDSSGRILSGDDLGRRVADWSSNAVIEKSVTKIP